MSQSISLFLFSERSEFELHIFIIIITQFFQVYFLLFMLIFFFFDGLQLLLTYIAD